MILAGSQTPSATHRRRIAPIPRLTSPWWLCRLSRKRWELLALIEQALVHHRDERLLTEAKARRLQISADRQCLAEENKAMAGKIIAAIAAGKRPRVFGASPMPCPPQPIYLIERRRAPSPPAVTLTKSTRRSRPSPRGSEPATIWNTRNGTEICGASLAPPSHRAQRANQERMTPEEAAIEIEC